MIAAIAAVTGLVGQSSVQAQQVRVTVTNNAPSGGVALTPVWFGFQDGSFDTFEVGNAASPGLESIAEDGSPVALSNAFNAAITGGVDGAIAFQTPGGGRPILGGETTSATFTVGSNNFVSYASMLLISNDYFIGNNNALDISSVLAGAGALSFDVNAVYDAGTEVNDFASSAANGAPFFGLGGGQTGPNQGADENGVVSLLSTTGDPFASFANIGLLGPGGVPANFNFNDVTLYPRGIATITISAVPEPGSLTALAGLACFGVLRRRRK